MKTKEKIQQLLLYIEIQKFNIKNIKEHIKIKIPYIKDSFKFLSDKELLELNNVIELYKDYKQYLKDGIGNYEVFFEEDIDITVYHKIYTDITVYRIQYYNEYIEFNIDIYDKEILKDDKYIEEYKELYKLFINLTKYLIKEEKLNNILLKMDNII